MSARVDLFAAAAERAAMSSGRAKSQELAELLHPDKAEDFGALWECLCGGIIGKNPAAKCPKCGK